MQLAKISLIGSLIFYSTVVFAQEILEDIPPALRDQALILKIISRIVEQDQREIWQSSDSKATIYGRPVAIRLSGKNVLVDVKFTPYLGRDGSTTLVAQGQIWIDIPNKGMEYQAIMQRIPLQFGEQVYFLPLGDTLISSESRIELQLELTPYTADIHAQR
ncbi:MAG: hypothetical protein LBQ77_05395 [Treponema sp.]|jgi:hypothetical protein|nr:hypothetical protein [Treponema sp.]